MCGILQAGNKFVLTALLVVKYIFLQTVVLMSQNYTVNRKRIPDLCEDMAVKRSAALGSHGQKSYILSWIVRQTSFREAVRDCP